MENNNYQNVNFNNTAPWSVDVDILFVIDNTESMLNKQAILQNQFVALTTELEAMTGRLPDVHIGVVTTDLGTGDSSAIPSCETVGGDGGILGMARGVDLAETCIGAGQRYIADVEPIMCRIDRDEWGICVSHDCTPADCDRVAAANEVLRLNIDARGCPRCRNYTGTITDTFFCLAAVGWEGCGFEQPLEAMMLALDDNYTPENRGFLRDSGSLAIVIVSDEDDCSASQPDVIFNPDPALDTIDSTLGYLHSFRCFEFGVTCDESGRTPGPRNNCEPRPHDDPVSLLHPIARYTAYLDALKDPLMTAVAVIGGPFEGSVVVEMDTQNRPQVRPTCLDNLGEGAIPGIRLHSFAQYLSDAQEMTDWAFANVCAADFTNTLEGLAARIAGSWLAAPCLEFPLAGCRFGPVGWGCGACLPSCTIFEIENHMQPDQAELRVVWCGEVCRNGLCTRDDMQPCTYDEIGRCRCGDGLWPTRFDGGEHCAPLHYSNATTNIYVDPSLASLVPRLEPGCLGLDCPDGTQGRASACWYLVNNLYCPDFVGIRVVRAADPPLRAVLKGSCAALPETEESCNDEVDNDQDCRTDAEDIDCF